ncbi:diguanylate cyclase (GGDEF)-like protein/PAS domain S-box-containing protein [Novosphingobium hassiacum]|uniref:Diguanylate cyclase (GGDEF)-like protein/PAS domain S-box-containing protein n=2 Tax=Novosphingobium hassiacum TaxID=173676 RepID=A0A7W5ZWX6_9SPHN|nr:diguanylate cyclase (GGDEF)-like protein/PAS domain S-box-containing protein [Novosphingobium hassiacum]
MTFNLSPVVDAAPSRLPLLAVIGMHDPEGADWGRLRGLQYSRLARLSFARLAGHGMAALLVLQTFATRVHPVALVAWMAVLVGVLISGARFDRTLLDADRRRIGRREMHRQTVSSVCIALVWAIPMALFAPFGNAVDRMTLWTILAMLMTGMAVTFASMPLGTVLFSAIVGTVSIGVFLLEGELTSAVAATAFVVIVTVGAVEAARTFLGARVAEAGMADKSEVVSLLLREFEEGDADWLWQVDPNRRVRSVSPRFAFALGEDPEDIDGKSLIQLIAGDAWEKGHFHPSLHDLAERLKRRESFSNLLVRVTLRGSNRWWELSASPKTDDNGAFVGFRGVGSDVTEQRESAEKIAYLARYDTLTGLPNRLMLNEAVGDAMGYAEKWRSCCAFLMIDLDRFKAVNDTLGHLVGDQLLAMVSERLKLILRDNEVCGRLGGDEFGVIIQDASDGQRVEELAQAIISTLSQPYIVDHHTLYVGASVGSGVGPRDGATVETLLRNADLALYRAKEDGGGRHCLYEPSLHAHAEERRQLEFSLRNALDRDEFSVVYQPVVDAITEQVVSFEALLRWTSTEHGFVSPAKFIPLAEDTRLIVPIGEWVLRTACREAMNWPDNVKIAVNVSGEQLLDPYFSETVVGALSATGLPPHRLEIEVTESIFVRDGTTAQGTLENLMGIGCGVALDDFGTGYSSLGYLRRMRFSTIKVDRSFVQGAAKDNPESLAIVRAVVAMADSLEMSTTAEGVETEAELAMIRKLGCKKIQGYFFGRPMSATDALALFSPDRMARRLAS